MYHLVLQHSCGRSLFKMGKSTISMVIFTSKLLVITRWLIPIKPHETTIFLWFSHGFTRVYVNFAVPPSHVLSKKTHDLPSGKRLHNYRKLQFIVDLPMKHGDFP